MEKSKIEQIVKGAAIKNVEITDIQYDSSNRYKFIVIVNFWHSNSEGHKEKFGVEVKFPSIQRLDEDDIAKEVLQEIKYFLEGEGLE